MKDGLHYGYDGWRRYLEGRPVRAGDVVEVCLLDDEGDEDSRWVQARYEYSSTRLSAGGAGEYLIFPSGTTLCLVNPSPAGDPPLRWPRR